MSDVIRKGMKVRSPDGSIGIVGTICDCDAGTVYIEWQLNGGPRKFPYSRIGVEQSIADGTWVVLQSES